MFTFGKTVKEGLKWICLCLSNTILLLCSGFPVLTPPFTLHQPCLTTPSHSSPYPKFNSPLGSNGIGAAWWDWAGLLVQFMSTLCPQGILHQSISFSINCSFKCLSDHSKLVIWPVMHNSYTKSPGNRAFILWRPYKTDTVINRHGLFHSQGGLFTR